MLEAAKGHHLVMAKKPLSPGPVQSTTREYNEKWFDRSTKTHIPPKSEILENGQRDHNIDNQELFFPVTPGNEQAQVCQEEDGKWHEKSHIPYHLRRETGWKLSERQAIFKGGVRSPHIDQVKT